MSNTTEATDARNAVKSLEATVRKFVSLGRSNAQTQAKLALIGRAVEYGNSVNVIHAAIVDGMHAAGKFDAPSRSTIGAYATAYRELGKLEVDAFDESNVDVTARVFSAVSNVTGKLRGEVYAAAMALDVDARPAFILENMPLRTPRADVKQDAETGTPVEAVDATPEDVVAPTAQGSHPDAAAIAQSLGVAAHHIADYSPAEVAAIMSAIDKFAAVAAPLALAMA